jgi:putative ABC transport system substrate-binding protein
VRTIGYLRFSASGSSEAPDSLEPSTVAQVAAFRQGLAALGYEEGQQVVIEYRFTDQSEAALREAAADLVRREVDVIVAAGSPAILAATGATTTIPIVFPNSGDPVGEGYVTSLARPGGNVTGLANINPQLSGKRLELLAQVVPGLRQVAYLLDPVGAPTAVREMQAAAQALGLQLQIFEIRGSADVETAFETASTAQADAVITSPGSVGRDRARVVSLAASRRLPTMYVNSLAVQEGGLMSYGVNQLDRYRRAASYVDRILKGAKPADLPVEQPREFEFVINLQAARALGLTIPPHVLAQATEVVK